MLKYFDKVCSSTALHHCAREFVQLTNTAYAANNTPKWAQVLTAINSHPQGILTYQPPYLHINTTPQSELERQLKQLMPWRKGPYQLGDLTIDSEWRGDMKWDRIAANIGTLSGKTVLDVGAGNGYFSYLLALKGAKIVVGIEPHLLFNYQFQAILSLVQQPINVFVLPLKLAQIPKDARFDKVFSMGVLYHQKNPLLHLQQLKNAMNDKAKLVLETLIIEQKYGVQIIPEKRYAKMGNVYCLPTVETLRSWLKAAGFRTIKLVNINQTSPQEQRATEWISDNPQSLQDFLDPNNPNLTIEGLPAPKRAIFICHK